MDSSYLAPTRHLRAHLDLDFALACGKDTPQG
jgi:hypothetical protein